jgi:hypothetical protein
LILASAAVFAAVSGAFFVWGWVLLGSGTSGLAVLLLYWAQARASKLDFAALQRKFDEVVTNIRRVDSRSEPERAREKAVFELKADFEAWADDFAKKHHLRKLQRAQDQIGRQTTAAEMTERWRPYLQILLEDIRNGVTAYAGKLRKSVRVDLPAVADDLFENSYVGKIFFTPTTVWRITTECAHPPRKSSTLSIWIYFVTEGRTRLDNASIVLYEKEFEMFSHGKEVLVDIDRAGTPYEQFGTVVADAVKRLIEAQFLELPHELG